MSMITATAWVPRGFAAPFPTKYAFTDQEFERIQKLARLQLDDAREDLADAQAGNNSDDGGVLLEGSKQKNAADAKTNGSVG